MNQWNLNYTVSRLRKYLQWQNGQHRGTPTSSLILFSLIYCMSANMTCFLNANNFSKDILAQGARPSGVGKTELSWNVYLEMRSHFGIPALIRSCTTCRLMTMDAIRHTRPSSENVPECSKWNTISGTLYKFYSFGILFTHGRPSWRKICNSPTPISSSARQIAQLTKQVKRHQKSEKSTPIRPQVTSDNLSLVIT